MVIAYEDINYIDYLNVDKWTEGKECFICEEKFTRKQKIVRIAGLRHVHRRKCWNTYIARTVRVFELKADDIVSSFGLSMRTARRIIKESREITL